MLGVVVMVRITLKRGQKYILLAWMEKENSVYYVLIFTDSGILSKEQDTQNFINLHNTTYQEK